MILVDATAGRLLVTLQGIAGVVERRHTLPILANVLLRRRGHALELTTTDLDIQLRTRADLGGDDRDFATTLPARTLVEILRSLPAGQEVSLASDDGSDTAPGTARVVLRAGESRYTLQALPADDFPSVPPAPDLGPTITLPRALLRGLIEQVEFAMAVQDFRYFLNGLLFVIDGRRLTLVATDGNRLALAQAELDAERPARQAILPRKTVHELLRLLRDGAAADAVVTARFAAAQARFESDGIELVTRLIEGRYPDYRRVIPRGERKRLTLGRAPLLASLQRASIMTHSTCRGVRMQLAPGALRIAASHAERGDASERLPTDYAGEALEIGFDVGYLTDVLGQSDDEWVTIDFEDARSSAMFTFPTRAGFRYVVGPMRI